MPRPDRRLAIVEAAFALIAERGLEGFRVRAVAERAGLNHATLLHYFPSREALLEGVIGHLLDALRQEGSEHGAMDPAAALRREFLDLRERCERDPDFFVVLTELRLRGRRDPAVAAPLARMYDAWRGHLSHVLRQGIAQGMFRAELPVPVVVDALLALFQGLALHAVGEGTEARLPDTVAWLDAAIAGLLRKGE